MMLNGIARFRRRSEIIFLKTTLCFIGVLDTFLDYSSRFLTDAETKANLQLGKAVHRCFLEEQISLQLRRFMVAHQLQKMRNELVALTRENRQLKWRLQIQEYEEDTAQTTRDSILEVVAEKSDLNQTNCQLRSELKRTQTLLGSFGRAIPAAEDNIENVLLFKEAHQEFVEEAEKEKDETGTIKVFSTISTRSFESDSTWISGQFILQVSAKISSKPD